ncbi:hypothetical protein BDF22DRAFT_652242 [Syncephalis plumigaleata]|nr:hypothetical protein BDF22DRAFT_652242 [Syncephalis plumigaleata]
MTSSINCDGRWELLPMYTILGIGILMIIVTLLPLLKGVDDAYGLRTELVILLSIGIGAFLISISLDIIPSELMPNWFNAVRAGLISMLAMCIIQFLTVILPVIRTWWWWRKRDNEAEHRRTATMSTVYLDTLCGDSVWMANLRQFSVKEFSAGNVLFLERYARFHNRFLCDQKTAICDFAAILTELEIIYDNFFSSRANVRIDISEETRHELDRQFMTRQLDTSVFERAYQEVWHAVALRTIPRYQQHISATNDIALSRLRGACDLIECNCADNVSTGHCHN